MKADFIANENIDRFLDMLRRPHLTTEKRTTLQALLVQEQDKLTRNREHLELSDRRVHEGKERVRTLRVIVATRTSDDPNRQRDETLLATMETTQSLLEQYNRRLHDEIFPYCIMLHTTMVGTCAAFDEAKQRAQQLANANAKHVVTIVDRSNGDSHVVTAD